jgi:hypothetical protein
MKQILNYDFLIDNEEEFYKWLDEGYTKGSFLKEECILKEPFNNKEGEEDGTIL